MTTKTTTTSGDEPENVSPGALFVATAGDDRGAWWTRDPGNSPVPLENPWRITKLGAGSAIRTWWESDEAAIGARLARLTTLHPDAPAEFRAFAATSTVGGAGGEGGGARSSAFPRDFDEYLGGRAESAGEPPLWDRVVEQVGEYYDLLAAFGLVEPRDTVVDAEVLERTLDPDNPQDCYDLADQIEQFNATAKPKLSRPDTELVTAATLRNRARRLTFEAAAADERLARAAQALYCNQTVRRTPDEWERLDTKLRAVWYDRARAALRAADDEAAS